ncbi:MAG TPA: M20/M25/M40 family metallo-hydrolase, partial [Casimicrobiaceae bacterium]|nr:M20/M25/M40 family metallo-hydrolase [Casimicrobiaceae bacterium]
MNAPASSSAVRPQLAALELIRTLVAFNTTSRDSNMALIDWVRDYLGGHGIESQLTFDDDRRKANLFATLPASDGNVKERGIVLSGHTDVVPVDGQPWDTDPFVATVKDDKLYGRGVADMKSFSATGLAMVPEFLRRGLKRPLHFALSYDEEVGCIGVRRLLADLGQRGVTP